MKITKIPPEYEVLVASIARKKAKQTGQNHLCEELAQAGRIGYFQALSRADENRPDTLRTYIVTRIRGAILDYLRTLDTVGQRGRRARRKIESARSLLSHKLGREPTLEELASETGIEVAKLDEHSNNHIHVDIDDMRGGFRSLILASQLRIPKWFLMIS